MAKTKDKVLEKVASEAAKRASTVNRKLSTYQLPMKAGASAGTKTAIVFSLIIGGVALLTSVGGQLLHMKNEHKGKYRDLERQVDRLKRDMNSRLQEAVDKGKKTVDNVVDKGKEAADNLTDKLENAK